MSCAEVKIHAHPMRPSNPSISGSCPLRRLAARLVPRFVPAFPQLVEEAVEVLMTIYNARSRVSVEHDVESIIQAARSDALRGLSSCLDAAARMETQDKAVSVTKTMVEFLLR